MIRKTYQQVVSMTGGKSAGVRHHAIGISGVSTDSRSLQPGNLFIPLDVGAKFDGHDFVREAFAKGASAALWQKDRPKPDGFDEFPLIEVSDTLAALQQLARAYLAELPVRVIGITGSNGKTTTKDMVASVLGTVYRVHKTAGNLNSHIGLPLTALQIDENTDVLVLEMGMRARREIELLASIAHPDIAVITNVGEAHLERLGSREEIARAKTEIAGGLKAGGYLIYCGDNPLIEQVLPEMPKPADMQSIRFGVSATNDLHPLQIRQEENGNTFTINDQAAPAFYLPVLGQHNVSNALAAIAVARQLGVSYESIAAGLAGLQLTAMRTARVPGRNGSMLLNDAYNASPASTRAAILLLEQLEGYKRKIAVLGDMLELGPQEKEFHQELGRQLRPDAISRVYTFGKLAASIAEGARMNGYPADAVHSYLNKAELIADLQAEVKAGDMVLVKGSRGMKLEEVVQALQNDTVI